MAASQSPHSASEPSIFSPGYFANHPSRKRKRGLSTTQTASTIREYGFMRDTGGHDSARFVGSSSGIHFVRNVHLRLARRSATRASNHQAPADGGNELVPGEDDQLRRTATQTKSKQNNVYLWKQNEVSSEDVQLPSFDQFVEWSKSYFEAWHPVLPFLNGPDVLRIFEDVCQKGITALDNLDSVIFRSVMSISLADSRQGLPWTQPISPSMVFCTVEEAMSACQFALGQPASIKATQAALSVQLFMISMLRFNAASRLGGLIVRMAFHLGLHRCPARYPFFTIDEAATRRRVFWCVYCLERLLCQYLGIPLDIRDDDVDVCFPGGELHETVGREEEPHERLKLLTLIAKHGRIRGLIVELRNKSIGSRQDTTDKETFVQTELAKWSNEIQDLVEEEGLDDDGSEDQGAVSSAHKIILLLSKYESTISLNRPMMASDPATPAWAAAMQACISAAKSICITMKRHVSRRKLSGGPGISRLTDSMLWPSFTWAIWISAFVLAYGAIEQQMPLDVALRHIQSTKDALRHIAARDTSWPEYCLSTIDELTSAVQELSSFTKEPLSEARSQLEEQSRSHESMVSPHTTNMNAHANIPTQVRTSNPDWQSFQPVIESSSGLEQNMSASQGQEPGPGWTESNPLPSPYEARNLNYGQQNVGATASGRQQTKEYRGSGDGSFVPPIADHEMGTMPGEGEEALMWYDQLFASTFSAIQNPFLASAQFDSSIDPNWSYLR